MRKNIHYLSFDLDFLSIHCHEVVSGMLESGAEVCLFLPESVTLALNLHPRLKQKPIPYVSAIPGMAAASFQLRLVFDLVWHWFRHGKPDLIYARQSYQGLLPILLAKLSGTPYFAESNGIAAGNPGTGWKGKIKSFLEKTCLSLADRVITPSQGLKHRIVEHYRVSPGRISPIPNGGNPNLFFPDPSAGELRTRLSLSSRDFVVGFVGSLGNWQGVETLKQTMVRVLDSPESQDIKFLIVGDYISDANTARMQAGMGQGKREMDAFVRKSGLSDRVITHPFVSYEESARFMALCDVLAAPYTRAYLRHGGGSPMKLYSYLATARPVIISDLGEFTDAPLLKANQAAVVIAPEDPGALAHAIFQLRQDSEMQKTLGQNGRRLVEKHRTWLHTSRAVLDLASQYGKEPKTNRVAG